MKAGTRIAEERQARGLSQQALADKVTRLGYKITQSGIDRIEKRDSERPRGLPEIARALEVAEHWLRTGKGPKHPPEEPVPGQDQTRVNLISWVSAGKLLRDDVAEDILDVLVATALPKGEWIALRVDGDSMDRISPPGSVIFINTKDKRLIANALYVIADEDGNATYKRYRPGPPPRFEPVSTNGNIEPIFPENEPAIIGRVRRTMLDT